MLGAAGNVNAAGDAGDAGDADEATETTRRGQETETGPAAR